MILVVSFFSWKVQNVSFSSNSLPFQDPCRYPGIPMEYRSVLQDFKTKIPQSIQIYQASDFILRLFCALQDLVKSHSSSMTLVVKLRYKFSKGSKATGS